MPEVRPAETWPQGGICVSSSQPSCDVGRLRRQHLSLPPTPSRGEARRSAPTYEGEDRLDGCACRFRLTIPNVNWQSERWVAVGSIEPHEEDPDLHEGEGPGVRCELQAHVCTWLGYGEY
jgi:hypothetical protein